MLFGIFAMLLLFGANIMAQQDSTLYKTIRNPSHWLDKPVTVLGIVEEYVDIELPYQEGEQRLTVEYILRGDFGDRIHIRSHLEVPETNTKYRVTGMFQQSAKPNIDYEIIETRREIIEQGPVVEYTGTFWDDYGLAVLIAGGVVVLLLIIFLSVLIFRQKPSVQPAQPPQEPSSGGMEDRPAFSSENDFKTIKVASSPPKTMRFIPGKLEIMNGEDKGKVFKMVGYPNADGSIVTMGREPGSGERAYSHIQLKDPTVSRKQAELIYKNGKLFMKNLSEVNLSMVNGKELSANEQTELKANDSVIRTGAIEFKYVV